MKQEREWRELKVEGNNEGGNERRQVDMSSRSDKSSDLSWATEEAKERMYISTWNRKAHDNNTIEKKEKERSLHPIHPEHCRRPSRIHVATLKRFLSSPPRRGRCGRS